MCLDEDSSPEEVEGFYVKVIFMEFARDNGLTESEFLVATLASCDETATSEEDAVSCISCETQLAAVVWN